MYFHCLLVIFLNEDFIEDAKHMASIEGKPNNYAGGNRISTFDLYHIKTNIFFTVKTIKWIVYYLDENPGAKLVLYYEGMSLCFVRAVF